MISDPLLIVLIAATAIVVLEFVAGEPSQPIDLYPDLLFDYAMCVLHCRLWIAVFYVWLASGKKHAARACKAFAQNTFTTSLDRPSRCVGI